MPYLWSTAYGTTRWWGDMTARCGMNWERVAVRLETHDSPHPECGCGLYAMHVPIGVQDTTPGGQVLGAVIAWGEIEVHEHGFRAQHARIVAIADTGRQVGPEFTWPDLRAIARRYGVPLVPLDELEAAAREHGDPVPESMRPLAEGDTERAAYAMRQLGRVAASVGCASSGVLSTAGRSR